MKKVSAVTKLRITSVGPNFCFAKSLSQTPETIFVSFRDKRMVKNAGTPSARFIWGKCLISYSLQVGDIVVAEIGDGNEKRRMAVNWAPESVWNGVKSESPASKTAGKVFDLIKKIDLPRLDPEKDSSVVIRVLDSNRRQLERGYGNLAKMLDREQEDIVIFSHVGNIIEAQIKKCWVQIKNPFVKATVTQIAA